MSGALPPPGTYFLAYSNFYSANHFKDNTGNNYNAGPLADIDINVWANVFRLLHVTNIKILGGSYAFHAFVPLVNMDFKFGDPYGSLGKSRFGLGDIIVDPFILAWHRKNFHWVTVWTSFCRPENTTRKMSPSIWATTSIRLSRFLRCPI